MLDFSVKRYTVYREEEEEKKPSEFKLEFYTWIFYSF
jgi:hypothetical protein